MEELDDRAEQRAQWERRQRRVRRSRDLGLVVLAIGVLVLIYVALLTGGR